jgi:hypothetical protein
MFAKTLATSLIPFVDTVAARIGKSRETTIKLIVACEVLDTLAIAAIAAWIF